MCGKISGKPIFGIGINTGEFPASIGNKPTKEYILWTGMLRRCTREWLIKKPTYIGCTISENFKSYAFFYEWCQEQVGFENKDDKNMAWHLDKDLLIKGNKLYSEDTCVFIPLRVNSLLVKGDSIRGKYPIGVRKQTKDKRFKSYCKDGTEGTNKQTQLGSFDTVEEAFQAYKTFKEAIIKRVAEKYKDQLDPRAYQALMNYQVEITD